MRLSDFDFELESHVDALKRSVKRSKVLTAEHSALVKLAFEYAAAIDDMDFFAEEHNRVVKMTARYAEILRDLGIAYERGAGRPSKQEGEGRAEVDATPRPLSLDYFRAKAINGV